jgi:hypothetical protein
MTPPRTATKNPVGRPRVTVTPEQVRQLRSQGASWRQTAKALGIGTATAMRLVLPKMIGVASQYPRDESPIPRRQYIARWW